MKKIILSLGIVMACLTANAQETEKKKVTKSDSLGYGRGINESGVSVKTEPKKSTKAKSVATSTTTPEEKKPDEQKNNAKKPE